MRRNRKISNKCPRRLCNKRRGHFALSGHRQMGDCRRCVALTARTP
nr:MAG TPA: hypothetical protein [Caudoviricetes sp.]